MRGRLAECTEKWVNAKGDRPLTRGTVAYAERERGIATGYFFCKREYGLELERRHLQKKSSSNDHSSNSCETQAATSATPAVRKLRETPAVRQRRETR
ncbi:hypothetical protein ACLKA6_000846, partial [Drosophila palustris]